MLFVEQFNSWSPQFSDSWCMMCECMTSTCMTCEFNTNSRLLAWTTITRGTLQWARIITRLSLLSVTTTATAGSSSQPFKIYHVRWNVRNRTNTKVLTRQFNWLNVTEYEWEQKGTLLIKWNLVTNLYIDELKGQN